MIADLLTTSFLKIRPRLMGCSICILIVSLHIYTSRSPMSSLALSGPPNHVRSWTPKLGTIRVYGRSPPLPSRCFPPS
ncbi:hypothetical protein BCV70DRAFT_13202 [Testicularia cyperi]|uniref:Uncharacterized protein n=1 Tax=Testicularia cyperi TaxID=1882483 RepID=A0A317XZI2_9BASI|nr:hypothetical protein BCV70DRAFT_13202 [Testicularia cyperi]